MYFIHVDHLNTPRLVANQSGQTVWRWDQQEPFGVNVPDENPFGLGAFEFPLRFPGQYADKETNLHYNYFRDYDPGLGRYVQSDPMGLRAGLDVYAYGTSNPLRLTDPLGLLAAEPGALASGWILRQTPGEAAQEMGERAGRICALNVPCEAGPQYDNLINRQCQDLINVPGGTSRAIAPVAFNACQAKCSSEWFKRCKGTASCRGSEA